MSLRAGRVIDPHGLNEPVVGQLKPRCASRCSARTSGCPPITDASVIKAWLWPAFKYLAANALLRDELAVHPIANDPSGFRLERDCRQLSA